MQEKCVRANKVLFSKINNENLNLDEKNRKIYIFL